MNGVEERVLYFYFQSVHDDQSVKQALFKEFYDDDFKKVPVLDNICYAKKPILIDEEPQQYDFIINEAFRSVLDNVNKNIHPFGMVWLTMLTDYLSRDRLSLSDLFTALPESPLSYGRVAMNMFAKLQQTSLARILTYKIGSLYVYGFRTLAPDPDAALNDKMLQSSTN